MKRKRYFDIIITFSCTTRFRFSYVTELIFVSKFTRNFAVFYGMVNHESFGVEHRLNGGFLTQACKKLAEYLQKYLFFVVDPLFVVVTF